MTDHEATEAVDAAAKRVRSDLERIWNKDDRQELLLALDKLEWEAKRGSAARAANAELQRQYVDVVPLQDAVVRAAKEFIASTSYFRQRKESRPEFERLAYAVLDLRKAEDANA